MKKLFFVLMIFPLMMVTSCKDNANTTNSNMNAITKDALIDQEIEAYNAQLPIQVDYASTLLALSREDSVVTYQYEFDEYKIEYEDMYANQVNFMADVKEKLTAACASNSELHTFFSLLSETGKVLHYDYRGNLSGRALMFEFSNDEIKEMVKDK